LLELIELYLIETTERGVYAAAARGGIVGVVPGGYVTHIERTSDEGVGEVVYVVFCRKWTFRVRRERRTSRRWGG